MDGILTQIVQSTGTDAWLGQHGLGWLLDERVTGSVDIIVGSLIVYYIGKVIIGRGIKHLVRNTGRQRAWHRKDMQKREETITQLCHSMWKVAVTIYAVGTLVQLILKIDLSPLLASAGIMGVALGFGAQSLIKDFLSGVFIISENQYRVGDIVDIGGATGTVERISTRTTIIRDDEGNVHYLPNGSISHVINKTMGYSISRFTINVEPSTDINRAENIINEIGSTLAQEDDWQQKILKPPRFVAVGDISGKAIELIITGKTQPSDQWAVTSEMRSRLLRAFQDNDITLAG